MALKLPLPAEIGGLSFLESGKGVFTQLKVGDIALKLPPPVKIGGLSCLESGCDGTFARLKCRIFRAFFTSDLAEGNLDSVSDKVASFLFLFQRASAGGTCKALLLGLWQRGFQQLKGFPLKRREKAAGWPNRAHCSIQQGPPPAWPGRAVVEEGRRSWEGPKPIAIVGSTGSIGTQTLDIVAENPDKFRVVALAAGSNVTLLADQVKTFKPQLVAVRNESLFSELKEALADSEHQPEIIPGEEGVIEVARHRDAVTVVTGIVGCAGLKPTVAAIEAGKDIALANKETLIAGGPFVLPLAHKHKVKILPADSEHSAIFQCIQGLPQGALRRIILTASGGAFRDWPVEKLKEVKVADALKHPNWNMGKKITVDSATLFNKGLEVIEAHYLYGAEYDSIEILIHPQSIIHSMVETQDSSVLAQLGWPDMRLPILYTMSWPERIYCSEVTWPRLDLCKLGSLTFKAPDNVKYPSMDLAYAAGRAGGTMTGVLSAANEKAVEMFIDEKISYLEIFEVVELTCDAHHNELIERPSLEEIVHYDLWARDYAAGLKLSSGLSPVPA